VWAAGAALARAGGGVPAVAVEVDRCGAICVHVLSVIINFTDRSLIWAERMRWGADTVVVRGAVASKFSRFADNRYVFLY
jgi:hypothetical protein